MCPYPNRNAASSLACSSNHRSTRHRIGHAFRNSWGRKDSESKGPKKSSSLVKLFYLINIYLFTNFLSYLFTNFMMQLLSDNSLGRKIEQVHLTHFTKI